ncbi:kelch motif family protein [Stylonychia lemnae]|uniref:Kelch motif family protein n=1 Tax=Stylonychia lemnae TaxID=5949 RepID=A0A078B4E7_STYLE|nr:kelch motif family protein [Stylonychia lemnae]|eukprot:CDW88087.1 kelch motif family protein [Stylonychia lemnae]
MQSSKIQEELNHQKFKIENYQMIIDSRQKEYQNLMIQNISNRRKIALMPQIRVKNLSQDLDVAKELFMNKNQKSKNQDDQTPLNKKLTSSFDIQEPSVARQLKDKSFESQSVYQSFIKEKMDMKEQRYHSTKQKILNFDTIAQLNESLFEPKIKITISPVKLQHYNSKPVTPLNIVAYDSKRLKTPQSRIQYSDIQIQLKRMQLESSQMGSTHVSSFQIDQAAVQAKRPGTTFTSASNNYFQGRRRSMNNSTNIVQPIQNIKYTNKFQQVPQTRDAFMQFYNLKREGHINPEEALAYLNRDPVSSNEVMECRKGCVILRSTHDQRIYMFGGRNIGPMSKLEIYDPKWKCFKLMQQENASQIKGRFNHSMVNFFNKLIVYGGQTCSTYSQSKSQCLKDMIEYNIDQQKWHVIQQNKLQVYARRNHTAFIMNKFMVIFGGINDFNQHLNETLIYDLLKNEWVENVKIEGLEMPHLSNSVGMGCFYDQRVNEDIKFIDSLPEIKWDLSSRFIQVEGFYMFGGLQSDGSASDGLWLLKCEKGCLRWVRGEQITKGQKPSGRYSHSMTLYERENALIICGGRNDRQKMVYNDLHMLTLDNLNWINVKLVGEGMINRADHHIVPADSTNDFVILGGIDKSYQLSNKITFLTFDKDQIDYYQRQNVSQPNYIDRYQ